MILRGAGKLLNTKCTFWFSPQLFFWNVSHSKKKWASDVKRCIRVFMRSTRYSCQILMKLEFYRQIFERQSNNKLHENMSGGSRPVPCGRIDMPKLTVAFLNFAIAHKTAVKGKVFPVHVTWWHMEGAEVKLSSFSTSALHGRDWPTSRPGCFTPGKRPQYPVTGRLDEPHRQSGRFGEEKNLFHLPGFESWMVSPKPRHYIGYAMRFD